MAETLPWRCLHEIEIADGDQTVMVSSDLFLPHYLVSMELDQRILGSLMRPFNLISR